MDYAKGTRLYHGRGPFRLVTAWKALCEDGKVRAVKATGQDTGSCKIKGKTVSGFVSLERDFATDKVEEYVSFTATGKHSDIFGKVA